jgi:hypothetical protein
MSTFSSPRLREGARPSSGGPLFILGAPRSGTSLLYKALCLHPGAAWISNWNRRFPDIAAFGVLNRLADRRPDRRMRVWFGEDSNAYVYGNRRRLADRLFPMPVEGEPIFTTGGVTDGDAQPCIPESAIIQLRNRFDGIARYSGGGRMISKRIANNERVATLCRAFPDATFVHLVRDGRAVASSLTKVNWWPDCYVSWYGGTPVEWAQAGGHPMEIAAREWVYQVEAVERGLEPVEPSRTLVVKYEAFVSRPLNALNEIARFAGLPEDDGWLDLVGSLRYPNRNNVSVTGLDQSSRELIESFQAPVLERYGYEL